MRNLSRGVVLAIVALTLFALAVPAGAQVRGRGEGQGGPPDGVGGGRPADVGGPPAGRGGRPDLMEFVETFDYTRNLRPMGFSERSTFADSDSPNSFNSDLAFWGNMAVQGSYAGFRLIDISSPARPREIINWEECASATASTGNQGDIIIWEDLIFRAWNSPTPDAGAMCGDWEMAAGEEGIHVIDISDPTNPDVIGFVDLPCGTHTETLVPDLENNRLLIYSNPSSGAILGGGEGGEQPVSCRGFDVVEIDLANPGAPEYINFVPAGDPTEDPEMHHSCHDTAVILGDVNLAACAGSGGVNVFDISDPETPVWLYHGETGGIGIGHSAAFTPDGEVLVVGHEPGGGGQARCGDNPQEYSYFFLDAQTGELLGQYTMPRPQTSTENCTVHNYNVVPTDKGYVLVAGNYQSGISVVDFTDPANAVEIAYADPAPLDEDQLILGGDWSTYWYNGFIYESDIRRGLIVWRLNDPAVAGARRLDHLNPQTTLQTFEVNPRGQLGAGRNPNRP